jgi:hypothetical protein
MLGGNYVVTLGSKDKTFLSLHFLLKNNIIGIIFLALFCKMFLPFELLKIANERILEKKEKTFGIE